MTRAGQEDPFRNRDVQIVLDTTKTRKPHVVLSCLAGFLGLGLGYAYVGKLRLGLATIAASCLALGFFAWTRLIVQSATMFWLVAALLLSIALVALIHPVVIAARDRELPVKCYNRWWIYLIWSFATVLIGPAIYSSRAGVLGYDSFRVASPAMSPTMEEGEFFVSDARRYQNHAVKAGEIVVFEKPDEPGVKFIKRVVAVAGDRIELRNGVLYRNGQEISEPYLHTPMPSARNFRNVALSVLGPGLIYVLGDYRDDSFDSRHFGPLPITSLRGRVEYIWLSRDSDDRIRWNRIGTTLRP